MLLPQIVFVLSSVSVFSVRRFQAVLQYVSNVDFSSLIKQRNTYLVRFLDGDDFHNTLVFHNLGLEGMLYLYIELHKAHIGSVPTHQHNTLPPHDGIIQKENDEHDQIDDVERHVPEQRPPGEMEHLSGEDGTHANHKQDVEDRWAHDGADANVAMWDKDTNQGGEEFRGRASCSHEGRSSHVVGDGQFVCNHSQGWNEELITHDGKGNKHVDHPTDV